MFTQQRLIVEPTTTSRANHISIPDATEINIQTDDPTQPIQIKQMDNGEIVILYEGECYLSVMA